LSNGAGLTIRIAALTSLESSRFDACCKSSCENHGELHVDRFGTFPVDADILENAGTGAEAG
jgi:hypothetical protein